MKRFVDYLFKQILGKAAPVRRVRPRPSCRLNLECLEERIVPSLIATQVLPLLASGRIGVVSPLPVASTNAVVVGPSAVAFSGPTPTTITLTDTVGSNGFGTPDGGTVDFTVGGLGTVANVTVVDGVARASFTVPAGTPPGTYGVTAAYSGNTGFAASDGFSSFVISVVMNCDSPATDALLGTAAAFAVLGGSTVTNTGPTTIIGNVGVDPGTAVVGFPPGSVAVGKPGSDGEIHSADAVAVSARNNVITAFNTLAGLPVTSNLTGQDLGGLTLTPGVYHFNSSAQLTGTLTLDAEGNANARWVFQIGSTLTTASGSVVQVINGGMADSVFWQVGSSATLGSTTSFGGNILALQSITLDTRASIACGRALAINGAVTMDTNYIDPTTTQSVAQTANRVSPAALYIQAIFQECLGQTATPQQVAYWERILQGPSGRSGVVQGIELSAQGRDYLVQNWYEEYLGRPAEGGEEMGYVNELLSGQSEAEVLGRFFASAQFASRSGTTNQQFIQTLYKELLNRPASAAEVQNWESVIAKDGRQAMATDLLNSQEYRVDAVTNFYQNLLGSQPDQGLAGWVSTHLTLAEIRMGFLVSNAFWNKVAK